MFHTGIFRLLFKVSLLHENITSMVFSTHNGYIGICNGYNYAKQKQPVVVKIGTAKQSTINVITEYDW